MRPKKSALGLYEKMGKSEASSSSELEASDAKSVQVSDSVIAVVPRAINICFNHDEGTVSYLPGTQEMPRAHATHWHAVANGVTIYA